jgi:hypothetical protein
MFAEILKGIEGIAAYPLASLMIFVPFFVGVCVMVIRMRKDHADRMSQLPLEE